MQILQDLNDQGITVVLVTHDYNVARHGERIVHLKDGLVVEDEIVANRALATEELAEEATLEGGVAPEDLTEEAANMSDEGAGS